MKLNILSVLVFLFSGFAHAAAGSHIDLKTPRGALIKLDIYNSGAKSALLLGPGSACSPRLDLYDTLGAEAKARGFTLIRLYWSYCLVNPDKGQPSNDLSAEREDFTTALEYVQKTLGFKSSSLYIGGKSQGSEVSWPIFSVRKDLAGLVLLTPVCTDPDTHKNVFKNEYPGLESEARQVLLVQGSVDPICENQHFQEYLKDKGPNLVPMVVKSGHPLLVTDKNGKPIDDLTAKNLTAVARWIFSWIAVP